MDVLEGVRVALGGIKAHKLRSFLTMLGIIVGVAAVIAMLALGEGARRQIQSNITSLGTNLLYVRPGSASRGQVRYGTGTVQSLTDDDAVAIMAECPSVAAATPESRGNAQVKYGNQNWSTYVMATTPDFAFVNSIPIESGTVFDEGALRSRSRVAVIGRTVVENVFGDEDPLGKVLRINRVAFTVIGTVGERGGTQWHDVDDVIYIPLSTGQIRVFGRDQLSGITVKVNNSDLMEQATIEIEDVLRRRHKLDESQENDFVVRNQAEILAVFSEASKTMTFLLAGIACVSLIVGGIGIMNIMLVSVTERTREIGIRMALGARHRDILWQFLLEALLLSTAGGVLGILLGLGGARAVARFSELPVNVTPGSVLVAFLFAGLVGVFFGLHPARKASRLRPIVALRYE
jgi:putative ABC transport system permease protein